MGAAFERFGVLVICGVTDFFENLRIHFEEERRDFFEEVDISPNAHESEFTIEQRLYRGTHSSSADMKNIGNVSGKLEPVRDILNGKPP